MTTTWLIYFPSPPRGVWHLGPVPIRAYALCIIVGIVVALLIGDRRWQARGGEPAVIYDIALWAVPFGLIGGRLYHLLTDWRTYFGEGGAGWEATPRIWDGGLGIWGAVALGGVGAWIGCRRRGIALRGFGDAVAPGIVLAQAIGRVGNYFNQELYGRETTLPWGMEIFWRQDAAVRDPHLLDGVSTGELYKVVQPTFLYELLWNILVFVVLIYVDRRFRMGHGRLFALYVAGYCIGRFGIELLRDDAATHIAGIRINSFTSTFVLIGAVVYVILAPKGREDPEAVRRSWQKVETAPLEPVPEPEKELVLVGAAATGAVGGVREPAETESRRADSGEVTEPEEEPAPEPAAEDEDDAQAGEAVPVEAVADEAVEPVEPDEEAEPEPAVEGDTVEGDTQVGEAVPVEAVADEAVEPVEEAEPEPAVEGDTVDGDTQVDEAVPADAAADEAVEPVEPDEEAEPEPTAEDEGVEDDTQVDEAGPADAAADEAVEPVEEAEPEPAVEGDTVEGDAQADEAVPADAAADEAADPVEAAEPEPAVEGDTVEGDTQADEAVPADTAADEAADPNEASEAEHASDEPTELGEAAGESEADEAVDESEGAG